MNNQVEQFKLDLKSASKAQDYIVERFGSLGLDNLFNIGFCPPSSSYGFDLINGRIVIPIYDVYGNYIAFAGRRIDDYSSSVKNFYKLKSDNLEAIQKFLKWKSSKWLNTPYKKRDNLYNLNNAKKYIFEKGYCFVVEGYFDVIHLHNIGFKNVVGLGGVVLSDRHCELIYRYCNKIVIMLDGDNSGQTATRKSQIKANEHNIFTNIVELPKDTDPDSLTVDKLNFIDKMVSESDEELIIKI